MHDYNDYIKENYITTYLLVIFDVEVLKKKLNDVSNDWLESYTDNML